ncbi:MAG: PIN domain-containing protein [Cyanobacteria bacterium P01_F01_bin.53]
MKKILFDSDVLLDVLLEREPFFKASARSLDTVSQEQIQGYVSGHSVSNIYYILRRKVSSAIALESLKILLQRIQVASVTDAVIRAALQSAITDFEDAIVRHLRQSRWLDECDRLKGGCPTESL